jgi:hypothetical protein
LPERPQALVADVVSAVAGREVFFSLRLDSLQVFDVSLVYGRPTPA